MDTVQTAFSSARLNRLFLGLGVFVLAVGVIAFVFSRVGGSDPTSAQPAPNFHPTLPVNSTPLKNASGVTIKHYAQLDSQIRSTIRTFLATAVARKNLGASWAVIAPSMKAGYTYKQWAHANALPVIPYPISNVDDATYYLDYASTDEILVDTGLTAKKSAELRPTRFRLGLVPVGQGAQKQWLVDYWMPLWTPPLPVN